MTQRTDSFDLSSLKLSPGQGRRLDLHVSLGGLKLGGEPYAVGPDPAPVALDISRMTHGGFALRLRFSAIVSGPCMRCLEPAAPAFAVDVREVDQAGGGEELSSPYVEADELDLAGWAHDALALALPAQLVCRADCAGLCPVCGENLNAAGPEHGHEAPPDPRWAKLSEIRFE